LQIPVYNLAREEVKKIEVSDYVFAVPFNEALVHQALVRQRANARQGTADTKTRGEVAGSTRKLHRQKHTGMARVGDSRSPTRRHGGVAFGPHPRSYEQGMPKKMRQLALRCALSAKASDGELIVLEDLKFDVPKTAEMARALATLGGDSSILLVTPGPDRNVILSARNLTGIKTLPAPLLNVFDLLSYEMLLMTEAAVRRAEEVWGEKPQGGNSESV
jgi:large subunit ribosomal protein L4